MDFAAVATALAGLADNVTGLNGYDYAPGKVVAPSVVVTFLGAEYRDTQMDLTECTARFRVTVTGRAGDPRDGQMALLGYLSTEGSASVPAATTASPTLGISGISATVTSCDGLELVVDSDNSQYYVAGIEVEVVG